MKAIVILSLIAYSAALTPNTDPTDPPKDCPDDMCDAAIHTAGSYYRDPNRDGCFFACRERPDGSLESHGCQECPAQLVYNENCGSCMRTITSTSCRTTQPWTMAPSRKCPLTTKQLNDDNICMLLAEDGNFPVLATYGDDYNYSGNAYDFIVCYMGRAWACMTCPSNLVWDPCQKCCNYASATSPPNQECP